MKEEIRDYKLVRWYPSLPIKWDSTHSYQYNRKLNVMVNITLRDKKIAPYVQSMPLIEPDFIEYWKKNKPELDISEIVVDYESAIEYLGIKDTLLVFKNYDRANKFNAQIKLQLIAEAWNKFDEFEADWENFDQYKYYPAFRVRGGNIEFSHTSFTNGLWGITRGTLDFHTSNFSFKTEERAKQFTEQFIDLFKIALGF